jgi:hypothetical protein
LSAVVSTCQQCQHVSSGLQGGSSQKKNFFSSKTTKLIKIMAKQYIFNNHGVCENPDIPVFFPYPHKSRRCSHLLKIETAMLEGKWVSGYEYNGYNHLGGSPCSSGNGLYLFDSEREAIVHEMKKVKKMLGSGNLKNESVLLSNLIEDYLKPKQEQLSLF